MNVDETGLYWYDAVDEVLTNLSHPRFTGSEFTFIERRVMVARLRAMADFIEMGDE